MQALYQAAEPSTDQLMTWARDGCLVTHLWRPPHSDLISKAAYRFIEHRISLQTDLLEFDKDIGLFVRALETTTGPERLNVARLGLEALNIRQAVS
jgi:hypothetical protein